jgi:hypothetical protein
MEMDVQIESAPEPLHEGDRRRCVGHGGMPASHSKTRNLPRANGHDRADWRQAQALWARAACRAPPALVLEGPNPLIAGEEDDFTPNGYAVLTLDGPHLSNR